MIRLVNLQTLEELMNVTNAYLYGMNTSISHEIHDDC